MFLFRDGLLTLMTIDSLISLERFCSSLPTMLKLSCGRMTCGVTVVMNRGGCFQMLFKPLSKCSSCLSYVLLITFQPITFESVYYATLFCYVVFIYWCHQFIFMSKRYKDIQDELVAPIDKDHITKKSGIIYRFKCDRLECDEQYIGETARTFGERFK